MFKVLYFCTASVNAFDLNCYNQFNLVFRFYKIFQLFIMRKLLLSIFCLLTYVTTQAQVSITAADLPTVGTTKSIRQQNLPDMDLGTASSTAQTWNFSDLNGTPKTAEFVAASTTSAASEFPSSTMARVAPLTDLLGIAIPDVGVDLGGFQGIAYYHTNAAGKILNDGININLDIFGFSLGEQNLEADPADLYLTPITYGQTVTNSGEFEQTIEVDTLPVPLSIILTIDRNINADAFGTLQLPGAGQPYSVLRCNEAGTMTLFAGVEVFGIPILTLFDTSFAFQNYRFMTPGQQYPLVSVTGNATGFGPAIASVEYLHTGGVSVEDVGVPTRITAYPNPADEHFSVQLPDNLAPHTYRLQLYNALGQLVADADYSQADAQDVSHLPEGLYAYQLTRNDDATVLLSGKVVIKH